MTDRYDEVMSLARAGLTGMIRRKDPAGISGLRSIITALENACAVPIADATGGEYARVGEAEAERRTVSDEEVNRILDAEIAMRTEQADVLSTAHHDLESSMARYQATLITRLKAGDLLTR